ncbi:MAG: NAD(P)/FAD-dependent oxidoreductase, partial [Pusillimonas sp.]
MKNIVVIGGGFAGLWSAVGAARKLDELNVPESEVKVTLIDQNEFHSIRVRNYENDLDISVIPFSKVLDPINVAHIKGKVVGLDLAQQTVEIDTTGGVQRVAYDKLVYALGSHVQRPPIAGLAEHSFDVDSQLGARRLEKHLKSLPTSTHGNEKYTALVVGAGLTGLEIACELPGRLAAIRAEANGTEPIHVIVADASSTIG